MPETYSDLLRDYLTVGIFGLIGAALVGLLLGVGSLLRPTRPQSFWLIPVVDGMQVSCLRRAGDATIR